MISKRIVLHFPRRLLDVPVISRLVRRCDLEFNILKASITPREEGVMVLELTGGEAALENGMQYLAELGVSVQPLSLDVTRNEPRCTHCGACVSACPVGALAIEPATMRVNFDAGKCIACELCVGACPVRAMEVHF